jgi:hypothetical protein
MSRVPGPVTRTAYAVTDSDDPVPSLTVTQAHWRAVRVSVTGIESVFLLPGLAGARLPSRRASDHWHAFTPSQAGGMPTRMMAVIVTGMTSESESAGVLA